MSWSGFGVSRRFAFRSWARHVVDEFRGVKKLGLLRVLVSQRLRVYIYIYFFFFFF
jgi:hypothetical protein